MIEVLMPPEAVAAPRAPRKRIGPRPQRVYGCPIHEIGPRIEKWCFHNHTTPAAVFRRLPALGQGLSRRPSEVRLREKMVRGLSFDAPPSERMSPGDIARHAGVCHSIVFTIAARIRGRPS